MGAFVNKLRSSADSLSRIKELEIELAKQKGEEKNLITSQRLAFSQKYQSQMYLRAYDDDLKVTPEMAEILNLSDQEQKIVNQLLAQTRAQVDKIVKANAVMVGRSSNSVSYKISPDPQGKNVEHAFVKLITDEIGSARADMLVSEIAKNSYGPLWGFGEQERDVKITWTGQKGDRVYSVEDRSSGPDGVTTRGASGASLPSEYQIVFDSGAGR